jgi:hypothetical protein
MQRMFIRTIIFDDDWKAAGLDDDDLRDLENTLLAYPKNVQTDLTTEQKKILNHLITAIKEGR